MECEEIQKKIIEILDEKKIEEEIILHINKCKFCKEFKEFILNLKREFDEIEILEPSKFFEKRLLSKILRESIYLKIFSFLISSITFLYIISIFYLVKSFSIKIFLFLSKLTYLCGFFSKIFPIKICYFLPPLIFTFILLSIFSSSFSILYLRKIYKEV
jgi:hypothetical protein